MKKKIVYYWASDISKNSGEGILANSFIKYQLKKKNIKFKNISKNDKFQKKNNFKHNKERYDTFFHKYIHPVIGIIKLRFLFLKKKNICYINYLPLWNFLIFLLLPSKTILGPITGSINREFYFNIVINQLEKISLKIIKEKKFNILFSHNFFAKKYNLDKRYKNNFILNDFFFRKISKNKTYDFVIYYRKNSKMQKKYILDLLKKLIELNLKIVVIGDKLALKGIKNLGYISREDSIKIISKSKNAIANPENLYSYFVQDCLSNHLTVFYNIYFKKFNIFSKKKMIPIFFKSYKKDFNIIKKNLII